MTEQQLFDVAIPEKTESYSPVAHQQIVEKIRNRIDQTGVEMKEYNRGYCYGCGDRQKNGYGYCYRDVKNGITEDVTFCWKCLLDHVEKYYGTECPISKAVRKYHDCEVKDKQTQLF